MVSCASGQRRNGQSIRLMTSKTYAESIKAATNLGNNLAKTLAGVRRHGSSNHGTQLGKAILHQLASECRLTTSAMGLQILDDGRRQSGGTNLDCPNEFRLAVV